MFIMMYICIGTDLIEESDDIKQWSRVVVKVGVYQIKIYFIHRNKCIIVIQWVYRC